MTGYRWWVGVLAAGCVVGCAGHAKAVPTPSAGSSGGSASSAVPSVTPSPSSPYPVDVPLTGHNVKQGQKPPLYPDAAKAKTQEAANAFARFFMLTWDWAYATTNSSYMKHYSGPECGLCHGVANGISKTSKEGHWFLGGRFTIRAVEATRIAPVTAPADFCSRVLVGVTSFSIVDKTGTTLGGNGAHQALPYTICSVLSGAAWQVTYLAPE